MADILPPAPVGTPFGSYAWADWYRKVRDQINAGASVPWTSITGKPTTVAGYGITDAVTIDLSAITLSQAVTNGAGAAAGTLNNAPTAGNPTKWLKFDDNGVTRYVPSWT